MIPASICIFKKAIVRTWSIAFALVLVILCWFINKGY